MRATPAQTARYIDEAARGREAPAAITYRFDTAWRPPKLFAEKLAQRYPHLYLRLMWQGEETHVHGLVVHGPEQNWPVDAEAVLPPEAVLVAVLAEEARRYPPAVRRREASPRSGGTHQRLAKILNPDREVSREEPPSADPAPAPAATSPAAADRVRPQCTDPTKEPTTMTTQTETPGLHECTPWKVESYELHDEYTHGPAPTADDQPPVSVRLWQKGPNAVVLEPALFLNGYTKLLVPPDGDPELRAPRADGGKTWLDVPHVELADILIVLPDGRPAAGSKSWPARAHRIDVETIWTLNGATTRRSLPTDLAFGRTDVNDPRHAYPYLATNSEIPSKTLETLILAAYSGADLYDPEPDELDQHRAAAHAAAEIAMHGMDGWLTAVRRLVEDRVLSCLQAETRPPGGIRILLHDEPTSPVKAESYSRGDPFRKPVETDPRQTRERANRILYEHGPFDGHCGVLLGKPVMPDSQLWRAVAQDARRRTRPPALGAGQPGARHRDTHGVVWVCETRTPAAKAWRSSFTATGADPDRPSVTTIHALSAEEHADLDKRVLGSVLQAVVDHEAERAEHEADPEHPIRQLLAECRARRETNLAPR